MNRNIYEGLATYKHHEKKCYTFYMRHNWNRVRSLFIPSQRYLCAALSAPADRYFLKRRVTNMQSSKKLRRVVHADDVTHWSNANWLKVSLSWLELGVGDNNQFDNKEDEVPESISCSGENDHYSTLRFTPPQNRSLAIPTTAPTLPRAAHNSYISETTPKWQQNAVKCLHVCGSCDSYFFECITGTHDWSYLNPLSSFFKKVFAVSVSNTTNETTDCIKQMYAATDASLIGLFHFEASSLVIFPFAILNFLNLRGNFDCGWKVLDHQFYSQMLTFPYVEHKKLNAFCFLFFFKSCSATSRLLRNRSVLQSCWAGNSRPDKENRITRVICYF